MTSLQVEIRQSSGKGTARKVRDAGKLPAVVYGPDAAPVSIACDPDALVNIFNETKNRNTLVNLELEGETVPCLVREVQRHPLSRAIEHVDFYRVSDKREVQVMVPLRPEGRPVGATLGGRLRLIRRELRASCLPKDIPEAFVIDATPMNIGDLVMASQIPLPKGVRLMLDTDIQVLVCYGKKRGGEGGGVEDAADAEVEAEAGGEGDGEGGEA